MLPDPQLLGIRDGARTTNQIEAPMRLPPPGGTATASTVADVLLLFVDAPDGLSITAAAASLGISKAVVHRILQSLRDRGLVRVDEDTRLYHLGPTLAALGTAAMQRDNLVAAAHPLVARLRERTGGTATVSTRIGLRRAFLDQLVGRGELTLSVEIGRLFPLYIGASGRAILAFSSAGLQQEVLSQLSADSDGQLPRRDHIERLLDRAVDERVAISQGERNGLAYAVASPILGADGYSVGSIAVCGPLSEYDEHLGERIAPEVRLAALDASRALQA